jgi:hypothetical protein
MPSRRKRPTRNRKRQSNLARNLERIRGNIALARRRDFKITPESRVTDPEFHVLSHKVVRDALSAVKIRTEKLDPMSYRLQEQRLGEEEFSKVLERVRKIVGPDAEILADKLIFPELDFGVQLRAAEMSIERVDPKPHRIDSGRKTKYSILRVDPNKKELVLEEKAGSPPAPPPWDEPI